MSKIYFIIFALVFIFKYNFTKAQTLQKDSTNIDDDSIFSQGSLIEKYNLIFIDGGGFMMGCDNPDLLQCHQNEQPKHHVAVKSFYLGKYELSIKHFKEFIDETNYETDVSKVKKMKLYNGKDYEDFKDISFKHRPDGKERSSIEYHYPVIFISHNDATEFCKWVSKKTGKVFRLPTEAEWEYAAKGGLNRDSFTFSGSDSIEAVAYYKENGLNKPHPPGELVPNSLGLYDMSGNVWEWCSDYFSESYYSLSPENNPKGPLGGSRNTVRGGSYGNYKNAMTLTKRIGFEPNTVAPYIGFRIVMEP
jgi:formylglycine-generating enzyme required for sulfatase activity